MEHQVPDFVYRNLYSDPRWQIILEKLGRSAEQLAMIEFEVNLPD
jgi:hypothetical protein